MGLHRTAALAAWAALVLSVLASTLYLLRDELPRDWTIRAEALVGGVSIDHGVRLAMPDGVTLAASLYLPRGSAASAADRADPPPLRPAAP